jgi:hypothetical protein
MLPDLPITETVDEVIVCHSNRLHVGIREAYATLEEPTKVNPLKEGRSISFNLRYPSPRERDIGKLVFMDFVTFASS